MKTQYVNIWESEHSIERLLDNIIAYPEDRHVYDGGFEYEVGRINQRSDIDYHTDEVFQSKLNKVISLTQADPELKSRIIYYSGAHSEPHTVCQSKSFLYQKLMPCVGNIHYNWLSFLFRSTISITHHSQDLNQSRFLNYHEIPPQYLFSCAQHRIHPHRVSLMLSLIETQLCDHGLCTWAGSTQAWDQFVRFTFSEVGHQTHDTFQTILANMLKIYPEHWPNRHPGNTLEHYEDCLFDIVSESTISPIFFTEKTWRPIIWRKPFIVIGPPSANRVLRNMGFDTFEEFWGPEPQENLLTSDYINDPHSDIRHRAIKSQIETLSNYRDSDLLKLKNDLMPRCEHNLRKLCEYIFDDNLVPDFMLSTQINQGQSLNSDVISTVRNFMKSSDHFKRYI